MSRNRRAESDLRSTSVRYSQLHESQSMESEHHPRLDAEESNSGSERKPSLGGQHNLAELSRPRPQSQAGPGSRSNRYGSSFRKHFQPNDFKNVRKGHISQLKRMSSGLKRSSSYREDEIPLSSTRRLRTVSNATFSTNIRDSRRYVLPLTIEQVNENGHHRVDGTEYHLDNQEVGNIQSHVEAERQFAKDALMMANIDIRVDMKSRKLIPLDRTPEDRQLRPLFAALAVAYSDVHRDRIELSKENEDLVERVMAVKRYVRDLENDHKKTSDELAGQEEALTARENKISEQESIILALKAERAFQAAEIKWLRENDSGVAKMSTTINDEVESRVSQQFSHLNEKIQKLEKELKNVKAENEARQKLGAELNTKMQQRENEIRNLQSALLMLHPDAGETTEISYDKVLDIHNEFLEQMQGREQAIVESRAWIEEAYENEEQNRRDWEFYLGNQQEDMMDDRSMLSKRTISQCSPLQIKPADAVDALDANSVSDIQSPVKTLSSDDSQINTADIDESDSARDELLTGENMDLDPVILGSRKVVRYSERKSVNFTDIPFYKDEPLAFSERAVMLAGFAGDDSNDHPLLFSKQERVEVSVMPGLHWPVRRQFDEFGPHCLIPRKIIALTCDHFHIYDKYFWTIHGYNSSEPDMLSVKIGELLAAAHSIQKNGVTYWCIKSPNYQKKGYVPDSILKKCDRFEKTDQPSVILLRNVEQSEKKSTEDTFVPVTPSLAVGDRSDKCYFRTDGPNNYDRGPSKEAKIWYENDTEINREGNKWKSSLSQTIWNMWEQGIPGPGYSSLDKKEFLALPPVLRDTLAPKSRQPIAEGRRARAKSMSATVGQLCEIYQTFEPKAEADIINAEDDDVQSEPDARSARDIDRKYIFRDGQSLTPSEDAQYHYMPRYEYYGKHANAEQRAYELREPFPWHDSKFSKLGPRYNEKFKFRPDDRFRRITGWNSGYESFLGAAQLYADFKYILKGDYDPQDPRYWLYPCFYKNHKRIHAYFLSAAFWNKYYKDHLFVIRGFCETANNGAPPEKLSTHAVGHFVKLLSKPTKDGMVLVLKKNSRKLALVPRDCLGIESREIRRSRFLNDEMLFDQFFHFYYEISEDFSACIKEELNALKGDFIVSQGEVANQSVARIVWRGQKDTESTMATTSRGLINSTALNRNEPLFALAKIDPPLSVLDSKSERVFLVLREISSQDGRWLCLGCDHLTWAVLPESKLQYLPPKFWISQNSGLPPKLHHELLDKSQALLKRQITRALDEEVPSSSSDTIIASSHVCISAATHEPLSLAAYYQVVSPSGETTHLHTFERDFVRLSDPRQAHQTSEDLDCESQSGQSGKLPRSCIDLDNPFYELYRLQKSSHLFGSWLVVLSKDNEGRHLCLLGDDSTQWLSEAELRTEAFDKPNMVPENVWGSSRSHLPELSWPDTVNVIFGIDNLYVADEDAVPATNQLQDTDDATRFVKLGNGGDDHFASDQLGSLAPQANVKALKNLPLPLTGYGETPIVAIQSLDGDTYSPSSSTSSFSWPESHIGKDILKIVEADPSAPQIVDEPKSASLTVLTSSTEHVFDPNSGWDARSAALSLESPSTYARLGLQITHPPHALFPSCDGRRHQEGDSITLQQPVKCAQSREEQPSQMSTIAEMLNIKPLRSHPSSDVANEIARHDNDIPAASLQLSTDKSPFDEDANRAQAPPHDSFAAEELSPSENPGHSETFTSHQQRSTACDRCDALETRFPEIQTEEHPPGDLAGSSAILSADSEGQPQDYIHFDQYIRTSKPQLKSRGQKEIDLRQKYTRDFLREYQQRFGLNDESTHSPINVDNLSAEDQVQMGLQITTDHAASTFGATPGTYVAKSKDWIKAVRLEVTNLLQGTGQALTAASRLSAMGV